MAVPVDLARDAVVLGDVLNCRKLAEVLDPKEDQIRLYAATVRRLLVDGGGLLAMSAASRGIQIRFRVPDSMHLLRGARNGHIRMFLLGGVTVFGVQLGNMAATDPEFSLPEAVGEVELKLESFLKQAVAHCQGQTITRHDVISYVSNKVGGVHYDLRTTAQLTQEKMEALGALRKQLHLTLEDTSLIFNVDTPERTEEPAQFSYRPDSIDAAYIEFLGTVNYICASPEVADLMRAIESDLRQHTAAA